jgi:hypothetical protein
VAYYCEEASWYTFTPSEQWIMDKTIRRFRRELQTAGFLDPKDGDRGL